MSIVPPMPICQVIKQLQSIIEKNSSHLDQRERRKMGKKVLEKKLENQKHKNQKLENQKLETRNKKQETRN